MKTLEAPNSRTTPFSKKKTKGESMKIDTITYDGEEYVILPKNAYNTLVYTIQGMKQNPTNDQVSLEEKAEEILAGGAAL